MVRRAVLGFELERRFDVPGAGVAIARVVSTAGVRLDLIQRTSQTPDSEAGMDKGSDASRALRTQGTGHVAFLVDNVDAALAEPRAKGVEVVHEVAVIQPADVRSFWVRDNAGHLIGFAEWLA